MRVNRPWVWAAIYLAAIPGFGIAYSMRAGDFYQPGIDRERANLGPQADEVRGFLTEAIRSRYSQRSSAPVPVGEGSPIEGRSVSISARDVLVETLDVSTEGTVDITVSFEAGLDEGFVLDRLQISIPWQPYTSVGSSTGTETFTWYPLETSSGLLKISSESLLPSDRPGGPTILVLDRTQWADLSRFIKATGGDPYYADGRFVRMMYVSATTITTLGPGDVQAVSSRARLLVGTEAVLGVMLAGLFLNAVAQRTVRERRNEDCADGATRDGLREGDEIA